MPIHHCAPRKPRSRSFKVGYIAPGTTAPVTATIYTGDISNEVNVAGGSSSTIAVGSLLMAANKPSTIDVRTGNLSSSVAAALGGSNGVWIGNINTADGGNVLVNTGSHSATATACVSHIGCLSELIGKDNCVMIGNIGLAPNCGNDDLIKLAIQELEKLGYEIADGVVKAADWVKHAAEKAWDKIKHF